MFARPRKGTGRNTARLAVIAGKGALPATLADNARSLGEDVVIIRLSLIHISEPTRL